MQVKSLQQGVRRCLCTSSSVRSDTLKTNAFGSTLPHVVETVGWEGAWVRGVTPWETNKPSPLLTALLTGSPLLSSKLPIGRVLVPGCGSGADALACAQAGKREVLAVDLSQTAIELCKVRHKKTIKEQDLKLTFQVADFFKLSTKPFDAIFDYTFLQALPKSVWPAWRDTMKRLLKPQGYAAPLLV
jgi:SAM-dependent methyltransferase